MTHRDPYGTFTYNITSLLAYTCVQFLSNGCIRWYVRWACSQTQACCVQLSLPSVCLSGHLCAQYSGDGRRRSVTTSVAHGFGLCCWTFFSCCLSLELCCSTAYRLTCMHVYMYTHTYIRTYIWTCTSCVMFMCLLCCGGVRLAYVHTVCHECTWCSTMALL